MHDAYRMRIIWSPLVYKIHLTIVLHCTASCDLIFLLQNSFVFPTLSSVYVCASMHYVYDYIICLHTCFNVCCTFNRVHNLPRKEGARRHRVVNTSRTEVEILYIESAV